jgi:UDP-N-acetylmuramate dehydrogenase
MADTAGDCVLVLGGGSNLVVADAGFPGTVIHVATSGVEVIVDGSFARVTAEAGEKWEPFVARAVAEGWAGIEALSGIPGSVGAVPIQNVGAYGQEVAETLTEVHVYDRMSRKIDTLPAAACEFGYRSSRFKREPGRYVVGAVTFSFPLERGRTRIQYFELARALDVNLGEPAPAASIRDAVLGLRRGKGMVLDEADHDTWSAGSFFTNPLVDPDILPQGAPAYPQADGRVKTSAAWLVEHAGLTKGYGNGPVSLSTKHALALTNRGGATTSLLLDLARDVRDRVEDAFGICLIPEPTLVNCSL